MNLKCALQRLEPDLSGYTLGAAFCCDSLENTEHPASQSRLADPGAGIEVLWQEAAGYCVDRANCSRVHVAWNSQNWSTVSKSLHTTHTSETVTADFILIAQYLQSPLFIFFISEKGGRDKIISDSYIWGLRVTSQLLRTVSAIMALGLLDHWSPFVNYVSINQWTLC